MERFEAVAADLWEGLRSCDPRRLGGEAYPQRLPLFEQTDPRGAAIADSDQVGTCCCFSAPLPWAASHSKPVCSQPSWVAWAALHCAQLKRARAFVHVCSGACGNCAAWCDL